MITKHPIRPTLGLLVLLGLTTVAEAQLDLFTKIDGIDYRIAGFSDERVVIAANGDQREIPPDAEWQLTGDVLENATFFDLSPSHSISRNSDAVIKKNPDEFGYATISVRSPTPKNKETYAAAVVWIVGKETVRVVVGSEALQGNGDWGKIRFQIPLQELEMAGKPAVLFWKNGEFVQSQARFKREETERAFRAVIFNDTLGLESAIAAGARLNATATSDKWTLAHYAAEAGSTEALQILLRERPQLALVKDADARTPLVTAAMRGRLDSLAILMDGISKDSVLKKAAAEALPKSVEKGQIDSLRVLLDAGADPTRAPVSERILMADAIINDSPEMCEMLIAAGIRPDFEGDEMAGHLLHEAEAGRVAIVRWLAEKGVKLEINNLPTDVLVKLAQIAPGELAAILLDGGLDPDGNSPDGLTPLIAAASAGNMDFARVLCQRGADCNTATNSGKTALHASAASNSPEFIELLLEHGADPSSRDSSMRTPLDVALLSGSRESATFLASRGFLPTFDSSESDILLEQAIKFDLVSVVASALEQGWSADSRFAGAWPAIRVAYTFGATKCEQLLRDAGAVLDLEDPDPIIVSSELDESPIVIHKTNPDDCRAAGIIHRAQTVTVEFVLDAKGTVLFPVVSDSDNSVLSKEALKAIAEWKYDPPRKNGNETATFMEVRIPFPRTDRREFDVGELTKIPVAKSQKKLADPSDPAALLMNTGLEARSMQTAAFATIEFIVLEDGSVTSIRPIDWSSRKAAVNAVMMIKEWKFKPGERRGKPVRVRVRQEINFH